ncbi:hypothetical protein VTO42DRAFT_4303 [Malbranchea cinnamomea]
MGAPSLKDIARRACVKMVKRIKDVGMAPYDLVRPILLKVENPEHLREIELNSPHLMDEDGELWFDFIKRDIPFWAEVDLPEKPNYELYCSLRERAAIQLEEDAKRIQEAMIGLHKQKRSSKLADPKKMKLPQLKPTAAERFAHYDRIMGGIQPEFVLNVPKEGNKGCHPWEDNSRWKIKQPKIPPAKPQATKKSGLPVAIKRNKALDTPTHRLNNGVVPRVVKAPRSFIEDYKLAAVRPFALRSASNPIPSKSTTQKETQKAARLGNPPGNTQLDPRKRQTAATPKLTAQSVKPQGPVSKPTCASPATGSAAPTYPSPRPLNSRPALSPPHRKPSTPSLLIAKPSSDKSASPTPASTSKPSPPTVRPSVKKRPADSPLLMRVKKSRVS